MKTTTNTTKTLERISLGLLAGQLILLGFILGTAATLYLPSVSEILRVWSLYFLIGLLFVFAATYWIIKLTEWLESRKAGRTRSKSNYQRA